jgi:hypothetical protein
MRETKMNDGKLESTANTLFCATSKTENSQQI